MLKLIGTREAGMTSTVLTNKPGGISRFDSGDIHLLPFETVIGAEDGYDLKPSSSCLDEGAYGGC